MKEEETEHCRRTKESEQDTQNDEAIDSSSAGDEDWSPSHMVRYGITRRSLTPPPDQASEITPSTAYVRAETVSPLLDSAEVGEFDRSGSTSPSTADRYLRRNRFIRLREEASSLGDRHLRGVSAWKSNYEGVEISPGAPCISQFSRLEAGGHQRPHSLTSTTKQWMLVLTVGVLVASVAILVYGATDQALDWKYDIVLKFFASGQVLPGCASYIALNIAFALPASLIVAFVAPLAGGSGIPEIKCQLNGIRVEDIDHPKTFVGKVLGVIGSVSASLPVGKEGPMIHSGAILGSFVSELEHYRYKNEKQKQGFTTIGAATGVAAAFGAPLGGTLFAIEEGSTYWQPELTFASFFCGTISVLLLNIFLSSVNGTFSHFYKINSGMLEFGVFYAIELSYNITDLVFFSVLGALGGLIGALFNCLNAKLTKFRLERMPRGQPWKKVFEVLIVVAVLSTVDVVIPMAFGCRTRPANIEPVPGQSSYVYAADLVQYTCNTGEYNELASLLLTKQETAIAQLFHSPSSVFSIPPLLVFFLVFSVGACCTYGIAVPSGLFVPSLLMGAAIGRVGGILAAAIDSDSATDGVYSVLGAAAVLGGIARIAISLAVIMSEATGSTLLTLPLLLTLSFARWCGDIFNKGIYDIHVHLREIPFLEAQQPPFSELLLVEDIMSKEPVYFCATETVERLHLTMKVFKHNGFPVVRKSCTRAIPGGSEQHHRLVGFISRRAILRILSRLENIEEDIEQVSKLRRHGGPERDNPIEDWEREWATLASRSHPIQEDVDNFGKLALSAEQRAREVDLTWFMNPAPYIIRGNSQLKNCYDLFRSVGMRHLCVLGKSDNVVGVVTRKDLLATHIERRLQDSYGVHAVEQLNRRRLQRAAVNRSRRFVE